MENIVAYFITGTPLLRNLERNEDNIFLDWVRGIAAKLTFKSPEMGPTLDERLNQAVRSWEYLLGDFTSSHFWLRVYRYFPDWCVEAHYSDSATIASLDVLISDLAPRFFAPPFQITIMDSMRPDFCPHPPLYLSATHSNWRISRSAHSYCAAPITLYTAETLCIEGMKPEETAQFLTPILVIEYDLRIMHRNLLDLLDISSVVYGLSARTDRLLEDFTHKADPLSGLFLTSSTFHELVMKLIADIEAASHDISTLACDIFTAALDLENYIVDINEVVGEATFKITEFYLAQSRTCYAKAQLLLGPVDALMEKVKFIDSVMDRRGSNST